MMKTRFFSLGLSLALGMGAVAVLAVGLGRAPAARADDTYQTLPYSLVWQENNALVENNWSMAPGMLGYTGADANPDGTDRGVGADPQTVLDDMTASATPVIHVNELSQASPVPETYAIVEFHPTTGGLEKARISMHANSDFDAPFLLFHLNTTGQQSINIQYDVIDVDLGATDATQPVALQYRIGDTGPFTNVPAGYIADATDPVAQTRKVTHIDATLPADADNQAQVQFRVLTTNASGADEFIAVDNISVTATDGTPVEYDEFLYLPLIAR